MSDKNAVRLAILLLWSAFGMWALPIWDKGEYALYFTAVVVIPPALIWILSQSGEGFSRMLISELDNALKFDINPSDQLTARLLVFTAVMTLTTVLLPLSLISPLLTLYGISLLPLGFMYYLSKANKSLHSAVVDECYNLISVAFLKDVCNFSQPVGSWISLDMRTTVIPAGVAI